MVLTGCFIFFVFLNQVWRQFIPILISSLPWGFFLVQKFLPAPRHPFAAINFGSYGISIEAPILVKGLMKSRYRGGKHHYIFVLVDKSKSGREAVCEYYCSCESGARTVGCCSHLMTIVWFLGYAQYHGIQLPNPNICNVSITIPKIKQKA